MQEDDPFLSALRKSSAVIKEKLPSFGDGSRESVRYRGDIGDLIGSDVYEAPHISAVKGQHEAEIREIEDVVRLVIDPRKIDYEQRIAMSDDMDDALEQANGFALMSASGIAEAVKGEEGKKRVNEIVDFYRGKVPPRFGQLLVQGMALRIAEDNKHMKRWEVRDRKEEIADAHNRRGHPHGEAYSVASICSSGYFDSNRLFQRMYREQVESGSWDEADYANAFEELVCEKPFVVFAQGGSETSYTDAYNEMIGKSLSASDYMYPLNFIDIRGRGGKARAKVTRAVEYIENQHDDPSVEFWNRNGQSVARVYHETL